MTRRLARAAGLAVMVCTATIGLGGSTAWKIGDVVVATGDGQYRIYTNRGVFKETLTLPANPKKLTAGCAFDSAFDLYTTDLSNTQVVRFALGSPHPVSHA